MCLLTRILLFSTEIIKDFFDDYNTSMPVIVSVAVGTCFLLLILIFIIFNRLVEARQTKVLDRAVHTTAIVTSLFPKKVRDRMIEEQQEADKNTNNNGASRKYNKFIGGNDDNHLSSENKKIDQKTIADLFLNCTVMFADIAGFTAWCS
jgi:hypothetical protein